MTALILSLLSNPTILAIGAGIVAVLGAFLKGRASGAKREREKAAAEELRAREVADEIDEDIGALPPELARKELRTWSKR